jgi:regulatory subunit for Cdc7p protein kinase
MQTVNPSLLEKNGDTHLQPSLKNDTRRDQGTMDVLQRARQMGMKIWALEKLQRMITTINDNDIGGQNDSSRNKAATAANGRGENDLSRVLRQELLNGPSDRDPLSSMELLMFKGPFIYIHDMNEKTKPVMVREYSKVARRQDGIWPQFRSAPLGKCPFIDEPPSRKEFDRHRMRQIQKEKKSALQHKEDQRTKPSAAATERAIDTKLVTELHKPKRSEEQQPNQPEAPAKTLTDESHERKSSESFIPPHFPRTGPFYTGREPAASGVQPSNVTSAIRSQMISSTAAAPGAKAGLSKEVHGLKRKVLEKGSGIGSMAAPQRPMNGSVVQAKSQAFTKPTVLEKNGRSLEGTGNQVEATGTKRRREEEQDSEQKKPERRRDPKPGYCENCRDKFDDFEEVCFPCLYP